MSKKSLTLTNRAQPEKVRKPSLVKTPVKRRSMERSRQRWLTCSEARISCSEISVSQLSSREPLPILWKVHSQLLPSSLEYRSSTGSTRWTQGRGSVKRQKLLSRRAPQRPMLPRKPHRHPMQLRQPKSDYLIPFPSFTTYHFKV